MRPTKLSSRTATRLAISARGPDWGPAAGRRVSAELVAEDGRPVARGDAVADRDGMARLELVPPGPGAYKIVARGEAFEHGD